MSNSQCACGGHCGHGADQEPKDQFIVPIIDQRCLFRNNSDDAGFDIRSNGWVTVPAKGSAVVNTGLQLSIPKGYYGKVESRSGLAFKHSIEAGAGIIDAGYRGEVKIKLYNHSDTDYVVRPLDRVAQLIFLKHELPSFVTVETLPTSTRGEKGFGSSDSDPSSWTWENP